MVIFQQQTVHNTSQTLFIIQNQYLQVLTLLITKNPIKLTVENEDTEPKAERIAGIFDKDKEQHQAGAIWDKEQLAPTLDTMQGGWRQPTSVLIKNNTKQGYVEATDGDDVDIAFPSSNTRRGRVQKDLAQTLDTSDSKGVVVYENTLNFYAKDDVLIDSDALNDYFNNEIPFEPDYIYVNPYLIKDGVA